MFRQERPQAGRLRQFHQFGAEALGSSSRPARRGDDAYRFDCLPGTGHRAILAENKFRWVRAVPPCLQENTCQRTAAVQTQAVAGEPGRGSTQNPLRVLDSKDEKDQALTPRRPADEGSLCALSAASISLTFRRFCRPRKLHSKSTADSYAVSITTQNCF